MEDRAVKRRRLLSETLKELRLAITRAADAGKWHSDSEWCHDTVLFNVTELMQVLRNIIADENKGGATGDDTAATGAETAATGAGAATVSVAPAVTRLLNKVWDFLADVLKSRPMFGSVVHFKGIFTELTTMGADAKGDGALIEALTAVKPGDDKQLLSCI